MLGLESNRVIGLRIAKLMRGGKAARREAQRMVSEKVLAAAKASTSLMAGASGDKIVEQYRRKVAATPSGSAGNEHGANENHSDLSAAGLTTPQLAAGHDPDRHEQVERRVRYNQL